MNRLRPQPGGFKRTNEGLDWRHRAETSGSLLGVVLDTALASISAASMSSWAVLNSGIHRLHLGTDVIDVHQALKTSQSLFCSLI